MVVGDKAGTLRGSERLDPQEAARLLLRGCRGSRPDSDLWGIAGAWTTGQQRSPTDHCGKRNSTIDRAKRQRPGVLNQPFLTSHGSYQRRPCGTLPPRPSVEEAPMSSEIPGDRPSDFSQSRPPDGAGYGAAPTARHRRNGMGTAALVVGVVALVLVVLILF